MSSKIKIALVFAFLGYVVIVTLFGLAYVGANITPRPVLYSCLAPTLAFFATEDVYWRHVLLLLAPVNGLLYGGVALGLATFLQGLKKGQRCRDTFH
jgi:hypothetical protein